jgi:twitching motility two-component system response regulator PilH
MAREILVADSDKTDQGEFQKIFETTDYHLIFSESGDDALLRAKLFRPDMIIASKTGLQEMGGLELCGAIKGDPECKHIPFILISGILDEISEKDRQRVRADGIISKPLNEDDILNLVDHLMEEEAIGKREEMVSEKEGEFLMDEIAGGEEEIIELLDVVEESEPRMSIDNFVTSEKEAPFGEITALESWDKLEFEEKPEEKELVRPPEKGPGEVDLQGKREKLRKEASPEEELFEKIELEEILEKVEQLKPSLEKEWPSGKEVKEIEEGPIKMEEPAEKSLDLEEFEAALQREVKAAQPEEGLQSLSIEEPKEEITEEAVGVEESVEEEELKELPEEEFPDELLEEILGEEEISVIGEEPKEGTPEEVRSEGVSAEEIKLDRLEEAEAPKIFEEEEVVAAGQVDRHMGEMTSLATVVDKRLEEVIAKGIQDMVGDFITKILPEMTQHIIGLTADRIEKMVKEVVPDLAEKAIQEEIKRLQKGEKG